PATPGRNIPQGAGRKKTAPAPGAEPRRGGFPAQAGKLEVEGEARLVPDVPVLVELRVEDQATARVDPVAGLDPEVPVVGGPVGGGERVPLLVLRIGREGPAAPDHELHARGQAVGEAVPELVVEPLPGPARLAADEGPAPAVAPEPVGADQRLLAPVVRAPAAAGQPV